MAKENFEKRTLTGSIKIGLKDHPTLTHWIADKAEVVSHCIEIVQEYADIDLDLSLRQLYYQLVSRDYIPNNDAVYKKLGSILDDCRISGQIDWDCIKDRGRVPYKIYENESVEEAIESAADYFRLDRMVGQETAIELWVEKDALSAVFKKVVNKYGIRLVINKGYSSSSAMYAAYQRFIEYYKENKKVVILYVGDHDSSGKDMIRDIEQRIRFMLCEGDYYKKCIKTNALYGNTLNISLTEEEEEESIIALLGEKHKKEPISDFLIKANVLLKRFTSKGYEYLHSKTSVLTHNKVFFAANFEVIPVALTMEQIEEFEPPVNPAKTSDPRAKAYIEEYGDSSWEVDALPPNVLVDLVEEAIKENINTTVFYQRVVFEDTEKQRLLRLLKQ